MYSRLWVINKTGMRIFLLTGEKKHNVVCKPYQVDLRPCTSVEVLTPAVGLLI